MSLASYGTSWAWFRFRFFLEPIPTQADNHSSVNRPLIACTGNLAFRSGTQFLNSRYTVGSSVGGTWPFSSLVEPGIRPLQAAQPPARTTPPVLFDATVNS